MTIRNHRVAAGVAIVLTLMANIGASGRALTSEVNELDQLPIMRPEFPVPSEPNMLFYIQRSVNANALVYAANVNARGEIDPDAPVDVYWRWYNVDGHRKPLNFVERMLAYGVNSVRPTRSGNAFTFKVAALPEREMHLELNADGHPEALMQFGNRMAKLISVYLQVDDSGVTPRVTALDLFGIDPVTKKPLREHIIPH